MEAKNNNLGLFQALKGSASNLLTIGKTRLELFLTEVQIEKQKVLTTLAYGVLGAFCLLLFLLMFVAIIAIAFWESKLVVISLFAGLFLILALILLNKAKQVFEKPSNLGKDTIAELQKDIALLKQEAAKENN